MNDKKAKALRRAAREQSKGMAPAMYRVTSHTRRSGENKTSIVLSDHCTRRLYKLLKRAA